MFTKRNLGAAIAIVGLALELTSHPWAYPQDVVQIGFGLVVIGCFLLWGDAK